MFSRISLTWRRMASRGQYGFLGKICSALASLVPNNALLWETITELFFSSEAHMWYQRYAQFVKPYRNKLFTWFARCRRHRRVAPAIPVWVAVSPAPTRFAPGRRSIVHADWRGCRFPPRALWFCVGAGYLSPTWRTHKDKGLSKTMTAQISASKTS